MNGWSDHLELAEDPSAPDLIYLHKYFQICIYFISQDMTKSWKQAAWATATLARGESPGTSITSDPHSIHGTNVGGGGARAE